MRYPKYLYLLKSVEFLVNLTAPNKKFLDVTSTLCLNGHKFIS